MPPVPPEMAHEPAQYQRDARPGELAYQVEAFELLPEQPPGPYASNHRVALAVVDPLELGPVDRVSPVDERVLGSPYRYVQHHGMAQQEEEDHHHDDLEPYRAPYAEVRQQEAESQAGGHDRPGALAVQKEQDDRRAERGKYRVGGYL